MGTEREGLQKKSKESKENRLTNQGNGHAGIAPL